MEIKNFVGLASDHAAFQLKQFVKQYLDEKGIPYKDYGTLTEESCNYATYGHALANAIEAGECYPGIAMCGSGEGISMTLNKHQGIRAGFQRSRISSVSTTMLTCLSSLVVSLTMKWLARFLTSI